MRSTQTRSPDSIRAYTKAGLRVYDALVMGVLAEHVWGCRPDTFIDHYRKHVTSTHADIGVGTGYCLDRCEFDTPNPTLALIDLQPACLEYAAKRLARYRPQTYVRDVLQPLRTDGRRFESIALGGVLHCLSGDMQQKGRVFDALEPLTRGGSKIFGYTLVRDVVERRARSRLLHHVLNRMRIISNAGDRASDLRRELSSRFVSCNVEQVGCIEATAMNRTVTAVCTFGHLRCDVQRAWEKVCFYEHIARKPSWLLRTILPAPLRTAGSYRNIGDVSRCLYSDGGFLTKRITHITPGKRIDFDIIEQTIRYCPRIVLLKGGTILIESHGEGMSSVRMVTRYELRVPKLLVHRFIVNLAVAAMHRIVIRDMRDRLEAPADAPRRVANTLASEEHSP
jgi:hypothetical protein